MDRLYLIGSPYPTIFDKDRKVRTEQGTQPAVNAVSIIGQFRGMIAFGVGPLGHDQHMLGAEFNTKTASLAPFLDNMNDATWYLDAVSIQGLSPITHGPSSIPHRTDGWQPSIPQCQFTP